jgi:hypothetical protein
MLLLPVLLYAQGVSDDERGWSFSQRFQGSSNYAGVVLKTNSTATYSFNSHLKTYAGFPIYFTRESSSTNTSTHFVNGVGNVYAGFLVTAENSAIHYTSDVIGTAPTGDRSRGFSTGHATVDWTNTFSHTFNAVTPFASVGLANTISDTSFFVRPFSSKGIVSHFESGAIANVAPHVSVGASGYAVRATGEQTIISKLDEPAPTQSGTTTSTTQSQPATTTQQTSPTGVIGTLAKKLGVPDSGTGSTSSGGTGTTSNAGGNGNGNSPSFLSQQEIVGPAALGNDHGFSSWLTIRPSRTTDFQIGYSRSMAFQYNSLFFGVGFRVGH